MSNPLLFLALADCAAHQPKTGMDALKKPQVRAGLSELSGQIHGLIEQNSWFQRGLTSSVLDEREQPYGDLFSLVALNAEGQAELNLYGTVGNDPSTQGCDFILEEVPPGGLSPVTLRQETKPKLTYHPKYPFEGPESSSVVLTDGPWTTSGILKPWESCKQFIAAPKRHGGVGGYDEWVEKWSDNYTCEDVSWGPTLIINSHNAIDYASVTVNPSMGTWLLFGENFYHSNQERTDSFNPIPSLVEVCELISERVDRVRGSTPLVLDSDRVRE